MITKEEYEKIIKPFELWGMHVYEKISNELKKNMQNYDVQIQISKYRTKTYESFIEKCKIKKYNDIIKNTDFFGMRFVTLFESDIINVNKIIANMEDFIVKECMNYYEDRLIDSQKFDYQSFHFLIFPKDEMKKDGISIGTNICCEIQVRNILQHAFAELSHLLIYKSKDDISKDIYRELYTAVAQSEITNMIYNHTKIKIEASTEKINSYLNFFKTQYYQLSSDNFYNYKTNKRVLKMMEPLFINVNFDEYTTFIDNNRAKIEDSIIKADNFYKQPFLIPLIYHIKKNPSQVTTLWEEDHKVVNKIKKIFGISIN